MVKMRYMTVGYEDEEHECVSDNYEKQVVKW